MLVTIWEGLACIRGSEHPTKGTLMALTTSIDPDVRSVGTTRRMDQLGRIVVPAELRKMLGIQTGDLVDFRFVDGHIALFKVADECALCGRREHLIEQGDKHVCETCVGELREKPRCAICGRLDALVERHGKFVCGGCVSDIRAV
jgi:transcriptional pleiotropic regulator of transition state genes